MPHTVEWRAPVLGDCLVDVDVGDVQQLDHDLRVALPGRAVQRSLAWHVRETNKTMKWLTRNKYKDNNNKK
jgi:hypothetical protein